MAFMAVLQITVVKRVKSLEEGQFRAEQFCCFEAETAAAPLASSTIC
jgi:hypothetical protein